jgi:hypothetical protein
MLSWAVMFAYHTVGACSPMRRESATRCPGYMRGVAAIKRRSPPNRLAAKS